MKEKVEVDDNTSAAGERVYIMLRAETAESLCHGEEVLFFILYVVNGKR